MNDLRRRHCGSVLRLTAVLLLGLALGPELMAGALAQEAPAIDVISPQPGETVTSDDIPVQIDVSNFTVDCAQAGRPAERRGRRPHSPDDRRHEHGPTCQLLLQ